MKRSWWSLITIGTGLVIMAVNPTTPHAYEIKKCDATAEREVKIAAQYIDDNLKEIVATFAHPQLTQDHRDEFIRKWPRANLVCRDEGSKGVARECAVSTGLNGMAHGGLGNKVNICYYNLVDKNKKVCELVGLLAHEFGHANGYPISSVHNDGSNPARFNDAVYTLGSQAETFCENDGSFNDRVLRGSASLALGNSCEKDDQCLSGKCKKDQCICDQDSDCPANESCFKPLTKLNYCSVTDKSLGASCSKNEHCRSDKCEKDKCVCKSDGDCPNGQACYTPVGKANYCASTTKALGASCSKDSQCASDKCEKDECVCKSDSDCPSGESCFTPALGKNYCDSTTKGLGDSCSKDNQCRSDKCQGGNCVCKKDSDCPDRKKCKKPVIGANHCE